MPSLTKILKEPAVLPQPIHVIPNLDVDSLTLNSVYNEMKQCLTNVHGEFHSYKSSSGAQIQNLRNVVEDETNGMDAMALRLGDVETDISHDSGIRKTINGLQADLKNIKDGKMAVELKGQEAEFLQKRLDALCTCQDSQEFRLETIMGILTRQQQQIDSLKLANAGNLANNIIDNVVIGGIRQTERENCRDLSAHFFIDRMNLHPMQEDIIFAERIGQGVIKGNMEFPPLMKVRCSPYFRSKVWEKRQCLKGQQDPIYKWKFFVDIQRPDVFKVANARYKPAMDKVMADNEGKEDKYKDTAKITGNRFFVNGEMMEDPVYVPNPKDLLCLSITDREELDEIRFDESLPFTLSNSTFKAYCCKISSYEEVSDAYKKMKLENIYASHIMMGCAFKKEQSLEMFSCDDGEDGGGLVLEKLISQNEFYGHAIFVIRWKMGGNMGARRFRCIESVADQVIQKVKTKDEMRSSFQCQRQIPSQNQTPDSTPPADATPVNGQEADNVTPQPQVSDENGPMASS